MIDLHAPNQRFVIQKDVLSIIFDPLRGIDIARIYLQHSSVIDFVIYFILFTGITRATLGTRFTGKPGRLISLAVGIILAIALSVTQYRMHFNIASFGPYAAALILCLAAVVFHQVLINFGASFKISLAISYILIYATIRSFVPSFFDWLLLRIPFLAAVLSLAFIIALITLLFAIWPKGRSIGTGADDTGLFSEYRLPINESYDQADMAERFSRHISLKENEIFINLKTILKHLPQSMRTNQGRIELIEALNRIRIENHQIFAQLEKMKLIDKAIFEKDIAAFQKILGMTKTIPKETMPKAIEALQQTRKRIELEKSIEAMEPKTREIIEKIQSCIGAVIGQIEQGDAQRARSVLGEAIQFEKPLKRIMDYLSKFERALKQDFSKACGTMNRQKNPNKPKGKS